MPLDVVILGPPGAGKGTQAERISAEAGIPHVNTGDILRGERDSGTEIGRQVDAILARGDLVSDEIVIGLVRDRLAGDEAAAGFVVDGFPRTLPQAEALDRMLADLDREVSVVLEFQVSDEVALGRLLARGRSDDGPETIRHRIEVQRVRPELIEYYRARGILVGIHADRTIDEVFAEVEDVLETAAAR